MFTFKPDDQKIEDYVSECLHNDIFKDTTNIVLKTRSKIRRCLRASERPDKTWTLPGNPGVVHAQQPQRLIPSVFYIYGQCETRMEGACSMGVFNSSIVETMIEQEDAIFAKLPLPNNDQVNLDGLFYAGEPEYKIVNVFDKKIVVYYKYDFAYACWERKG